MRIGAAISNISAALACSILLSGCATQFRNHGYVPSNAELANIIVGSDSRETVANLIGRPSATGMLAGDNWYYVESRFRHVGFFAPREVEREVVAISFAANGKVANIEHFGLQNGQVVTLSSRVTPTSGSNISFIRQLLGNISQASAEGFL